MILRSLQRNRILTDRRDDGPRIFAWPDLVVADRTSPYPKQRRWRPHRRAGRALAGGDARLCRPRPEARHARDLSAASAPMAQPVVPRLLERPVRGDPHRRQNLRGDAGGGRTDGNADRCCHAETVGGRHAAGFAIGYPAVPSAQAERWVLVYLGARHSPANAPIFSRSSRATAWDPRHQNVAGKMAANHPAPANSFASAVLSCAAIEHGPSNPFRRFGERANPDRLRRPSAQAMKTRRAHRYVRGTPADGERSNKQAPSDGAVLPKARAIQPGGGS